MYTVKYYWFNSLQIFSFWFISDKPLTFFSYFLMCYLLLFILAYSFVLLSGISNWLYLINYSIVFYNLSYWFPWAHFKRYHFLFIFHGCNILWFRDYIYIWMYIKAFLVSWAFYFYFFLSWFTFLPHCKSPYLVFGLSLWRFPQRSLTIYLCLEMRQ